MDKINRLGKYLLMAGIWVVVSCTQVELCPLADELHPHVSDISIAFNWKKINNSQKPDSMICIANRIINSWRMGYIISTADLKGNILFTQHKTTKTDFPLLFTPSVFTKADEGNSTTDNLPTDNIDPTQLFQVPGGDYLFITVNQPNSEFFIPNLEEFENNLSIPAQDIVVQYQYYQKNDTSLLKFGTDWIDYNPYSEYVATENTPLFMDVIPQVKVEQQTDLKLTFTPQPITQPVTLSFTIEKQAGISIDDLIAEISGIPAKMSLSTGKLYPEKTYKMLFRPRFSNSNKLMESLRCQTSFFIPGLIRSNVPTNVTGPGILQLVIYASMDSGNGQILHKAFQVCVNLYNTLSANPLTEYQDDSFLRISSPKTIDIKTILHIDKDGLLDNPMEDDKSLDVWRNSQNIHIDI